MADQDVAVHLDYSWSSGPAKFQTRARTSLTIIIAGTRARISFFLTKYVSRTQLLVSTLTSMLECQPINAGYSYSDDGSTVNTTPVASVDVYAFLQLFLARFPKYASAPFHIAGSSYGGTYGPHFASTIHKKNKELSLSPMHTSRLTHINLASIIIGNGHTNALIQVPSTYDYACDPHSPYPLYDDPDGSECRTLKRKLASCAKMIQSCYDYDSRLVCSPAALYCALQSYSIVSSASTPLNLFCGAS